MASRDETWVKVWRSMLNWEWYRNTNTKVLFMHLLLIANTKPQKREGCVVPVGSVDRTQEQLMHELGFSRQQVRTALSNLESTKEITKVDMGKFSIISIVRWSDYQARQPRINQDINQESTKEQPRINHLNKNNKEYKEYKEYSSVELDDDDIEYDEEGNIIEWITPEPLDSINSI